MAKDQPDKRLRPEPPKDPFGDFQYRQALAEEMLPMIGRIYRSNVHLLLYGKPLVNLSVSEIMNAHRFVRETENNELSEFETYQVIVALSELELGPAEVDIGIIAAAYLFEDKGLSLDDFVKESVEDLIGKAGAILDKAQDVVLYGFGRIGRLLTRMLIEDSAGGDNLRLRAIVVRKAIDVGKPPHPSMSPPAGADGEATVRPPSAPTANGRRAHCRPAPAPESNKSKSTI